MSILSQYVCISVHISIRWEPNSSGTLSVSDNKSKAPDYLLIFRSIQPNDDFSPAEFLTLDGTSREVLLSVNNRLFMVIPECQLAYAGAFVNFHLDSLNLCSRADVVERWIKESPLRLKQW